jgi:hypothetical protein
MSPRRPVRFKADQKIEFVMRFDSTGIDPSTLVALEALTRSKGKRELLIVQVGAFGTYSGTTNGQAAKSLNFAKYGEHSYRFTPAEPLSKRRVCGDVQRFHRKFLVRRRLSLTTL